MTTSRILVALPGTENVPVDFQLLKQQLRVGDELDDLLNDQYLPSAIEKVERLTRRNIVSRETKLVLDDFPRTLDQVIRLPRGKVTAIQSIAYSIDGSVTTLTGPTSDPTPGSGWQEDLSATPAVVMPPRGDTWPSSIDDDVPQPIVITYTAGYTNAAAMPKELARAVAAAAFIELDGKGLIPDPGDNNFDAELVEKLCLPYRTI